MTELLTNRWFLLSLRLALGAVFLYSGYAKLGIPLDFADSITTFQVLPPELVNSVAMALPPFELLLGLMLVVGWRSRVAALAVALLSIVFGIALAQAILRGLPVDCGCFGSGKPSILTTWSSFVRSLLLLGSASCLYWVEAKEKRVTLSRSNQ